MFSRVYLVQCARVAEKLLLCCHSLDTIQLNINLLDPFVHFKGRHWKFIQVLVLKNELFPEYSTEHTKSLA